MFADGQRFVVRRAGNRAINVSERTAAGFIPRPDFCGLISIICLIEVYDYVDLCPVSVTEQTIRAKSRQAAQAVLF